MLTRPAVSSSSWTLLRGLTDVATILSPRRLEGTWLRSNTVGKADINKIIVQSHLKNKTFHAIIF